MNEEINSFDDYLALAERYKKIVAEKGEALLIKVFNEFFQNYPEVKAVAWTQYTPYFNDGEPCVFKIRDFYGSSSESYDENRGLEYGEPSKEGVTVYSADAFVFGDQEYHSGLADLVKKLRGGKEVLLAAIGDHAKVFVTKDGLDIEEYSHD